MSSTFLFFLCLEREKKEKNKAQLYISTVPGKPSTNCVKIHTLPAAHWSRGGAGGHLARISTYVLCYVGDIKGPL